MNELLKQISSYHLFNYLLPGCLFAECASKFTHWQFIEQNLLLGLFLYYFYGLVISRIGSLVIEPILKATHFVKYADYNDYVAASKKDPKIDILNESNNMYRTICAVIFSIALLRSYEILERHRPISSDLERTLLAVLIAAIFLFSYRKQTSFIAKRVVANKEAS